MPVGPNQRPELIQEQVHLAEQASELGIKVLPSTKWAWHYPAGDTVVQEKLQALLNGTETPEAVAPLLKPDALLYNVNDLHAHGVDAVSSRIRDMTGTILHYDHDNFARFIAEMRGKDCDLDTLRSLYDATAESRIRAQLRESYGPTGKRQLETNIRNEAQEILKQFSGLRGIKRTAAALRLQWMEKNGYIHSDELESALAKLDSDERMIVDSTKDAFLDYANKGDRSSFDQLTNAVQKRLPDIQRVETEMSPEMEALEKELEKITEPIGKPGSSSDPAIPPDDQDEYHTPPPTFWGEKAPAENTTYFEIVPVDPSDAPLIGYFRTGQKAHFDRATNVWSKKKKLEFYTETVSDDAKRWTIRGRIDNGLKALPIPDGYTLDFSTRTYRGSEPNIFRDQHGCFYIEAKGNCAFTIEFLKNEHPIIAKPTADSLSPLTNHSFTQETEAMLQSAKGTPEHIAEHIRNYLLQKHFYPGGGDAGAAQKLQYKLRHEPPADQYLQRLEGSEYLECYSMATLYAALMRRAGVPTDMVIGDFIQHAEIHTEQLRDPGNILTRTWKRMWGIETPQEKGKTIRRSVIDATTGHAWNVFWNGKKWVRIDATPPAKPRDKKKDEEKDEKQLIPGEGAQDPALPPSPYPQNEEGNPMDHPGTQKQANDQEMKQAEEMLKNAQEQFEQMQEKKEKMENDIQKTESFRDLNKIKEKLQQEDLLDEMKKELEEKIQERKDEIKKELSEDLDKMTKDGFLTEKQAEQFEEAMENDDMKTLEKLQKKTEKERKLYEEYERIRERIMPKVEEKLQFFYDMLPREEEWEIDEDSVSRQGRLNRRAITRFRNILFGQCRNPRTPQHDIDPRFIGYVLLDVSGSMEGAKLAMALQLLVFYCELFARVSEEYGYMRFAIGTFSDGFTMVKDIDHEYDSVEHYDFPDGERSTVKVRLMKAVKTTGGTNMLPAIQAASQRLNDEKQAYPDHLSALYFLGDGEDTSGNTEKIKEFMKMSEEEGGFGDHLRSAILLGNKSERHALSSIFGDENTQVANSFDTLVDRSMEQMARHVEIYFEDLLK